MPNYIIDYSFCFTSCCTSLGKKCNLTEPLSPPEINTAWVKKQGINTNRGRLTCSPSLQLLCPVPEGTDLTLPTVVNSHSSFCANLLILLAACRFSAPISEMYIKCLWGFGESFTILYHYHQSYLFVGNYTKKRISKPIAMSLFVTFNELQGILW